MLKELSVNIFFYIITILVMIISFGFVYGIRQNAATDNPFDFIQTGGINFSNVGEPAFVYVSGYETQKSPYKMDGLLQGNYKVSMKKAGFKDYDSIIPVFVDDVAFVHPILVKTQLDETTIATDSINNYSTFYSTNDEIMIGVANSGTNLSIIEYNAQKTIFSSIQPTNLNTYLITNLNVTNNIIVKFLNQNGLISILDKDKNTLFLINYKSQTIQSTIDLTALYGQFIDYLIVGDRVNIVTDKNIYWYYISSNKLITKISNYSNYGKLILTDDVYLVKNNEIRKLSNTDSIDELLSLPVDSLPSNITWIYKINEKNSSYLLADTDYFGVLENNIFTQTKVDGIIQKIINNGNYILTNKQAFKYYTHLHKYNAFDVKLKYDTVNSISSYPSYSLVQHDSKFYLGDEFLTSENEIITPKDITSPNLFINKSGDVFMAGNSNDRFVIYKLQ